MATIEFSFDDYIQCLNGKSSEILPKNPMHQQFVDKRRYYLVDMDYQSYTKRQGERIEDVFRDIEQRTCDDYYRKVYDSQKQTLEYSTFSFPAYKFIMSEVLADDWLAIVDFHKKHCRDHALHQPLVAYITAKLLGFGKPSESLDFGNEDYLLDRCVKYIMQSDKCSYLRNYLEEVCPNTKLLDEERIGETERRYCWNNLFYETAIMASMFHDIGYPWQYINKLTESLHTANFVNQSFSDQASYVWRQFHDRLLIYPFYGYVAPQKNEPCGWDDYMVDLIRKSMEKTHGFPGALGFLYLNDIVRKYPCIGDDAVRSFCVDWVAMAIMMHDMMKVYRGKMSNEIPDNLFLRINLETDPLSWVVAFADFLEEFERPSLCLSKNNKGNPEYSYVCPCSKVKIEYVQDILKVTFVYKTDAGKIKGLLFKKEETENYFDSTIGYLDINSAGISKVELNCVKQ